MRTIARAVLVALLLFPLSAFADSYGAIARSPSTGRLGWSYGFSDQQQAQRAARQSCGGRDCTVVTWEGNACAAIAVDSQGGWGSTWANDQESAQNNAINLCESVDGGDCTVRAWVCS